MMPILVISSLMAIQAVSNYGNLAHRPMQLSVHHNIHPEKDTCCGVHRIVIQNSDY